MNHTRENRPAHEHVRTALEGSCAVLMALELIRSRAGQVGPSAICHALDGMGAEAPGEQALLELAIDSLRDVIAELRLT